MDYNKIFKELNHKNAFLIVSNSLKERVIELKSELEINNNTLYQFSVLSESEFISLISFKEDKELYIETLNDNIPLAITKEKLKFSKYNFSKSNEDLDKFANKYKDYLNVNEAFKDNLNNYNFYILGNDIYLKPFFKYYNLDYQLLELEKTKNNLKIHRFSNKYEEIFYLFETIASLIDAGEDINNIYIANSDDSYKGEFTKAASFYNLLLEEKGEYLYDIPFVKKLLNDDLEILINNLDNLELLKVEYKDYYKKDPLLFEEVINNIITIFNNYSLNNNKEVLRVIIIDELKSKRSTLYKYKNIIKLINVEEILTLKDNEIVFIINAKYESFPNIAKNNDYLSDKDKMIINYPTSSEVNESNHKFYEMILNSRKIKYVSYSQKDYYNEYSASDIINSLIEEKHPLTSLDLKYINKTYAKEYYKYIFASFNEDRLLTTFNGDFKLNEEEKEVLINYVKEKQLKLSPSSLDTYLKIPFIFYVEKILKISNYEESVNLHIGNFFHAIVGIMFKLNFKDIVNIYENEYEDERLKNVVEDYVFNKQEINNEELFNEFLPLYFNSIEIEESLKVKTLFYLKKNKDIIIEALDFLKMKQAYDNAKEIHIERSFANDKMNGRADLIQIYQDDSYSIIDYKTSARAAYTSTKVLEVIDDLLEENPVAISFLELIKPFLYAWLLNSENKELEFRDVGFYSFFIEKQKINSLMRIKLFKDFYTYRGEDRIINYGDILTIYNKLEKLVNKVYKNINNANFTTEILKDKNNKTKLEKEWYSIYEAVAFFNQESLDKEEEDEELFT